MFTFLQTSSISVLSWYLYSRNNLQNQLNCVVDSDCGDMPYRLCGAEGICIHKQILPVTFLEVIGLLVFAMFMALSNIAGIGGGGVAVPLLIGFFHLDTKPAIAISSLNIALTTLTRFILNWHRKHPEKPNVAVIDYNIATIMMPTCLAGAQIGAFMLVTFPALVIQIMLTLTVAALCLQTYQRALIITREEEEKARLSSKQPMDRSTIEKVTSGESLDLSGSDELQPLRGSQQQLELGSVRHSDKFFNSSINDQIPELYARQEIDIQGKKFPLGVSEEQDAALHKLKSLVFQQRTNFQWDKQIFCLTLVLIQMGMNLSLGSKQHPSIIGIERCEPVYWVIQGAFIWICALYATLAIAWAQSEQQLKMRFGNLNLVDSDIRYHGKSLTTLIVLGFAGGLAAGALGIGGGAIFTPSLLTLGIPPLVVTGTGLFLVLFSTCASSLIYALNGELNFRLGLWIAVWAIAGTIIGLRIMQTYIRKTGKQSIVVWTLVWMFIVSVIAVPLFGGLNLKKQYDAGLNLLAFRPLCL